VVSLMGRTDQKYAPTAKGILRTFDNSGARKLQFCAEYPVPESVGDSKSVLIVGKVMLEMILFEFSIMQWETIFVNTR
jgi:hypothetical protein